jgi:hypothetical protein
MTVFLGIAFLTFVFVAMVSPLNDLELVFDRTPQGIP